MRNRQYEEAIFAPRILFIKCEMPTRYMYPADSSEEVI